MAEDVEARGVLPRSGMCTAGAFYFVNESGCGDLLRRRDVLRLACERRFGVLPLDPIGLMRRVGLGETLRIALMGNDERVGADTALRSV